MRAQNRMTVPTQSRDASARRTDGSGIPLIPHGFIERTRLSSLLDSARDSALIVVRGSGGSGKSGLVASWLRDQSPSAAAPQRDLWVSLDDGARSRSSFWRRIVRAFQAIGSVTDESPLSNFILGYAELDDVPGLVLAQLEHDRIATRLVLDDFHLVDDDNALDIVWLLKQSHWLTVVVTTRRRGHFEALDVAARIHSTVITEDALAFTPEETRDLFANATRFSAEHALIAHAATRGHPLATRIAVTLLMQRPESVDAPVADPAALTRQLAAHIAQSLLPAFAHAHQLHFAAVASLPPELSIALASTLSGRSIVDAESTLEEFANEGLGEFREVGSTFVFRFHPLISEALQIHAAHSLSAEELRIARLTSATQLSQSGNGLEAIKLFISAGAYEQLWPTVAHHFSELIVYQQDELHTLLSELPTDIVALHGTAAISLAVVMSERERTPSARLRQLVAHGIDSVDSEWPRSLPHERLLLSLARFAGLRAARRYEDAAAEGDRFVAQVELLSAATRSATMHAISAGIIQIVITNILLGRWERAISIAHLLAADHHEGRTQHRSSLLAYVYAFTGNMRDASAQLDAVTHVNRPGWRTSVPSTGWHIASALRDLEDGQPERGLSAIALVGARLDHLEHWPTIVWTRARLQLAAGRPQVAFDELTAAVKQNEFRPISDYARSLLQSMKADLQLALGHRTTAEQELDRATGSDTCAAMLARERLALSSGSTLSPSSTQHPEFLHAHGTPREFAEALLLDAARDALRGHETDAEKSLRRAADVMSRHGLTSPSVMVPHTELRELASRRAPELVTLFDAVAQPFARIALINPLSPREREVLATLAQVSRLEDVAQILFISVNTVKSQLRNAYRKLDVSSGPDAVRVATENGFI
ncbi:LuxR family transcriptional regulator [Salinibacterium sp. NYA9b]